MFGCAVGDALALLQRCLDELNLEFSTEVCERLLWLGEELLRWNKKVNLTSICLLEEVVVKHLADSLTVVPLLQSDERLLDVGSGGGFPGLPLAIVDPARDVVTVDAVGKKIHFQRHVVRRLGLDHCLPLHLRMEDLPRWSDFDGGFDVILSRAFASIRDFARLAHPCLSREGRLLAMKGPEGDRELRMDEKFLRELGLEFEALHRFSLPLAAGERQILLFRRI
ncbi:MAG: 16S rRNA (guanine(527)-N(7))-methyltransferase RsmG [Trichloromonas sp.]|nr:16S rRNA (guanine(527)-N(7))-methyltransferase RsmG [Trichloromonas sp.]